MKPLLLAAVAILCLVALYASAVDRETRNHGEETGDHARHVSISVSPTAARVQVSHSQQFTANVSGTPRTAVIWSVNGIAGGNSTVGRVDSSGFYTAPSSVPGSSVTITAHSVAKPVASANAAVTVVPMQPVTVTISPNSVSLPPGQTQQFSAWVSGSANSAVQWLVNGAVGGSAAAGTITSAGRYTSPKIAPTGSVTVTAQSVYDSASYANASVVITPHQVILSWSASPSTVVGYNVYRSMQASSGYTRINPALETTMNYTDGNVSTGQTYFYAVTAVNSSGGESGFSNVAPATIP